MKDIPEKKSRETSESMQVNQGKGGDAGTGQASAGASGKAGSQQTQQSEQRTENVHATREQGDQQSRRMSSTNGGRGQSPRSLMRHEGFFPSLWKENPFGIMRRFSEEMDRIFDEFGLGRELWGSRFGRGQESRQGMWSPQVEMHERDNQLIVCIDLPGLKKDDIQLEINDEALVIKGERHQEFEDTHQGYYRSERSYGSFYRTIPLPEGTDAEQAKASFQDGVLKISLPLPQQEKPRSRRIEVQDGGSSSIAQRPGGSESSSSQPKM
jgi:HSP20 family protein